jgi:enoyl-[acyl-carrier protein] reductase II
MKTRVTEMLGIAYPIFQGGMGYISESQLASAVSNAGGAGIIASGGKSIEWTRDQIIKTKKLTNKPFGVNLALQNRKDEFFKMIDVIREEKVPFVTIGGGDPIPFIKLLQESNVIVIGMPYNTRLAIKLEAAGIDMIILEGTESGGRIGTMSTLALMTNVIPEVKIPVIAAGGITDGRGLAAALMMGADAIQMGTRFLVSEECIVHPQYKELIIKASDEQSVTTGLSRNLGFRGLKSPFTEKYIQMETSGVPSEELMEFATGASKKVAEEGLGPDGMNGMILCGQGIVPVKGIKTVQQIIDDVMGEAEQLLMNAPKLVTD